MGTTITVPIGWDFIVEGNCRGHLPAAKAFLEIDRHQSLRDSHDSQP